MTTPLDVLIEALQRAADYNPAVEAPPEAVLWCDERREFTALLPALRARLPQLLTLGDYHLETRTGPAVWLRVAVARVLPEPSWLEGAVPVVYLPGVGRETVRDAQGCPELLRPLVWLGVVGTFFGHVNGKDWTLRSLLAGERGPVRLDVPDDAETRAALATAAPRLLTTPLASLRGRRLDADALHAMLAPDLPADMLDWLDGTFDGGADPARFSAFAAQSAKTLGFDPKKRSRHDGAASLAAKAGAWAGVWGRFEQSAGTAYSGVVELLRTLQPPPDLLADRSAYPRVNAEGEDKLRAALAGVEDAGARLAKLEQEHAWRRETVWARRGEAPLAEALAHLVTVASAQALPAQDAERLAEAYAESGWRVDLAALRALAAAPRAMDRAAVVKVLQPLYLAWLDQGALALQELARAGKVPLAQPAAAPTAETLVFVDGLRMDLAHRLKELLQAEGAEVTLSWCWSGFPTVTATCKPLASPVAKQLRGGPGGAGVRTADRGRPVGAQTRPGQAARWRGLGHGRNLIPRGPAVDRGRKL